MNTLVFIRVRSWSERRAESESAARRASRPFRVTRAARALVGRKRSSRRSFPPTEQESQAQRRPRFEEWKVRKTPNLSIVKTADAPSVNAGQNIGFTITVTNSGVADATGVTISDPLPGGPGIDWSESPDNPNCSISGSPATVETLNCGPVTLAATTGSLSVHVQSATTGASCGTYNNTASFTSTNAGDGEASASVTVNCGALQITKTAKHADTSGDTSANLEATFTVVDALGNSHSLTTDATTGVDCVEGIAVGLTQSITESGVPAGYSAPTIANVTVASGTCADAGVTNVNVENTPLTDISWSVDSLHEGGTSTTVTCYDGAGTALDGYPVTVSDGTGSLPNLVPTDPTTTVSCDFVVDP